MKIKYRQPRLVLTIIVAGLCGITLLAQCKSQNAITMKVNSFAGSAYEIGFTQGEMVLEKNPFFKYIFDAPVFAETTPENFKRVCEILQQYDPQIIEEMRGFTDALKVSYEDVVVKLSGYGIIKPAIPNASPENDPGDSPFLFL